LLIVFLRLRTRIQSELDLYKKQAPVFLAGHSIKWLANFGQCEVLEGPGVEGVGILEFPTLADAKHGTIVPPTKRQANIDLGVVTTAQ
jgi:uncharacterized protein (DUF1330 family)